MTTRLLTAISAVLFATVASAGEMSEQDKLNKRLQGKFLNHETASCLRSENGFGPPPQLAALGKTHLSHATSETISTFSGDGTFTADGTAIALAADPAPQPNSTVTFPVTKSTVSCHGVYQVNADNTYTVDFSCAGNTASGVIPGLAFTATGLHENGVIQKGGKAIQATGDEGQVEYTSTIYGTDASICSRFATGLKTEGKNDDN